MAHCSSQEENMDSTPSYVESSFPEAGPEPVANVYDLQVVQNMPDEKLDDEMEKLMTRARRLMEDMKRLAPTKIQNTFYSAGALSPDEEMETQPTHLETSHIETQQRRKAKVKRTRITAVEHDDNQKSSFGRL